MRFIIVPDIHYLQDNHSSTYDENIVRGEGPPTEPAGYKERLDFLIETLKVEKEKGLDFFIANGDLVHDDPTSLPQVKEKLDEVGVPYYVSHGNHDRATEQYWQNLWGRGRNTDFEVGDYAFILLTSSDETGARIPVDDRLLEQKLDQYSDKKGVLFVTHVPQTNRWRNSPDAVNVRQLLSQSPNVIGAVSSHVHGVIATEKIDGVVFSMAGHFAHYGRNFYTFRRFEIDENDVITNELYDATHNQVIAKHTIRKRDQRWQWLDTMSGTSL